MNRKKILSLLLAAILLSSATACGESQTETTTNDDTTEMVETEPEETEDARLSIADDLPDVQYDGNDFTILCYDWNSGYMYTEELTGDVVNDAIYNRNFTVSDRFDVSLVYDSIADYGTASATVKSSVMAGDDNYQIAAYHIIQMGQDILGDVFLNLANVPHINFDKPWWNDTTVNDLSYKGVSFLGVGYLDLASVSTCYAIFYNKDIASEYNLEDVYTIIDEGKWTKDKMKELASVIYKDVNGNGERDNEDMYGMGYDLNGGCDQFLWFFGKKICTKQEDGSIADTYYDEKLVDFMNWMYDYSCNTQAVYTEAAWNVGAPLFSNSRALMIVGGIGYGLGLRDSEIDYAILPPPKWDEAQENYTSVAEGNSNGIAVLQTVQDLEMVGVITEALTAEGWKTMLPAYYETALKFKGTRDEKSVELLDLIVSNTIYDFGYIFCGESSSSNPGFWTHKVLQTGSANIASQYESGRKNYESTLQKVFNKFEEYISSNS